MSLRILISIFILCFGIPSLVLATEYIDAEGVVRDAGTGLGIPDAIVTFVAGPDTSVFVTGPSGHFGGIISGVSNPPMQELLGRSYPNPVNAVTIIPFSEPGRIQIYDVRGRLVLERRLDETDAVIQVDKPLPAGVFLYRLLTEDGRHAARKMTVNDGVTRLRLEYVGRISEEEKASKPEQIETTISVTAGGFQPLTTTRILDPGSNVLEFELEPLSPCATVIFVDMDVIEIVNNESCVVVGANCDSVDVGLEVAWSGCDGVDRVDLLKDGIPVASSSSGGGGPTPFVLRIGHEEDFQIVGRVLTGEAMLGQTNALRVVSDLTDPVPVFTDPTSDTHQVWVPGDDAAVGTPGFQAEIDLTITDGGGLLGVPGQGDGWLAGLYYRPFGGGTAQVVTGTTHFTNDPETLSFLVTLPVSGAVDTLSAAVLDASGNESETRFAFEISQVSCFVDFLVFNGLVGNSWCVISNEDCGSADIPVEVIWNLDCPVIDKVELRRDGITTDTIYDPDPGYASFPATFTDGDSFMLSAVILRNGEVMAETASVPTLIDFQDPTTEFVADWVGGWLTPAEGSSNSYEMGDDQDPFAPGLQIPVRLDAGDPSGGLVLQDIMRITDQQSYALLPENVSLPYEFTGTDDSIVLYGLSFSDGVHQVVATVRDRVGNTSFSQFTMTVDMSSP